MPQKVIINRLEAHPKALIRNNVFALGNKFTELGESYDPMESSINRDARIANPTWREKFLVVGSDTSKPYIAEPASIRRSGHYYQYGYLIDVFESISQNAVVARTLETNLGRLTVGEVWEPIGEKIEMIISENGFHIGSDSDLEVVELPIDGHFNTMNSMLSSSVGADSRLAGLVMQSTLQVTNNLLGLGA